MAALMQFSQQDPRWKGKLLGTDRQSTIGSYGCLLTSMSMVCSAHGFDVTPDQLNDEMRDAGGFQGAFVMPVYIGKAVPGMRQANYIECPTQPAPLAEIDSYLAAGKPVIVEVDYSPSAGVQNHWIVLTQKQGDDYVIQDPWPYPSDTQQTSLTAKYGFAGKPAQIIQAALWLDGPAGQTITAAPPKLDTGTHASFKVYATADDLAIRSQTLATDATLIKRVPMNTEFTPLVADADAKARLGVMNQWLPVLAADGTQGYVAAWYLSLQAQTPSATPPPKPVPVNAVVVKTIADAVALRSKPDTSDATLIKRLPVGAELKVLDPPADVQRKLGVVYEWLNVQDVTGTQGVIAAWYVSVVSGLTAIGAQSQRETQPPSFDIGAEPLPVLLRAAEENLALRTEPVVRERTLIKRLPLGAEMIALDPPDVAARKIGCMGDWIHVRVVAGDEGYVAAWAVVERPADPAPSAAPADS
ncbi:MAG: C39 family peptidase [Bacteroidota bacterium]